MPIRISRTAAYAIHAIVHIAEHGDGQLVIGRQMARRLGMPENFLVRILVALARSGILSSIKGPNGGYSLGLPAASITVLDILEAVEGPVQGTAGAVSIPPDRLDRNLAGVASNAGDVVRQMLTNTTVEMLTIRWSTSTKTARSRARAIFR